MDDEQGNEEDDELEVRKEELEGDVWMMYEFEVHHEEGILSLSFQRIYYGR